MKQFFAVFIVLFLAFPVFAQETTVDLTPLTEVIEAQLTEQRTPGLGIAIILNGDVILSEGFGVRSLETNDPVTADTLFRIGSTTKPLTTIGLMLLVEDGLIDLDAPVSSYVPEFTVSDAITVRHLLSHTSGMSDYADPFGRTDAAALSDYIASLDQRALFAQPGEALSYSNPGFDTLGRIIEVVSGQTYADYMADVVFPALGMERSTLLSNVAMTYPLAVGHSRNVMAIDPVRPMPDNAAEYPAGFVYSSPNDLLQLAQFVINAGVVDGETVLSEALAREMQSPVARIASDGYGLGLFVSDYRGAVLVGHDGAINGYASFFNTLPEYGLGVIVLANAGWFNPTPIFDAVVDLLIDLPALEAAPPPELTAEALEEYTGTYEAQDVYGAVSTVITVSVEEGALIAHVTGQPTLSLIPAATDLFEIYVSDLKLGTQVFFQRNSAGEVAFINVGFRSGARDD